MQAVIPAAGEGTRLRPLTDDRPKGLVEVAGTPLLTHAFETLCAAGVTELVVVVGYRGEDIVDHYGDTFQGRPVHYAWQDERVGLADALLTAAEHVDGPVLMYNGDNVCDANVSTLLDRHTDGSADVTMLVDDVSRQRASEGGVLIPGDDGEVAGVVEKPADPPSTLIPRGCYAFSRRIFTACRRIEPSDRGEYEISDAIDWLLARDASVEIVPLEGWCINVNTEADLARARNRLKA